VTAPLYTRDFLTACCIHLVGALSLAMWFLLPLYVKALGGSDVMIGTLLGVAALSSVAARPLVGALLDRVGRRRMLLFGSVANALTWMPFLWLTAVGPWLVAWTVVHAVVGGAMFATYFTYATDLIPPARRAEGIAIFGMAGMAANGLGPFAGEIIIERAGYRGFFATAVVLALLSTAMAALVPRTVGHAAGPRSQGVIADMRMALRHPGIARVLVVTVLLGVAINAAYFFVAPFVHGLGLKRAGPFFAAYSATSVIIRFFGRRALDDVGPHRVSVPAFAIFAVGLVTLGFLPSPGVLVLSGIACGAGHGTLFPVLNALATQRAPAGLQGTVVSLHTAAIDLGAVAGTPLCGALAQWVGYPAMFTVSAVACLAGCWLIGSDPMREPVPAVARGGRRWGRMGGDARGRHVRSAMDRSSKYAASSSARAVAPSSRPAATAASKGPEPPLDRG
jgi:MFS family permease